MNVPIRKVLKIDNDLTKMVGFQDVRESPQSLSYRNDPFRNRICGTSGASSNVPYL